MQIDNYKRKEVVKRDINNVVFILRWNTSAK